MFKFFSSEYQHLLFEDGLPCNPSSSFLSELNDYLKKLKHVCKANLQIFGHFVYLHFVFKIQGLEIKNKNKLSVVLAGGSA